MRTTRQIEAAEVHKVCAESPVSGPTGQCSRLQIYRGSRRTQTTLAPLQHCKVVKVSQSSISLGVILRIMSTKQAPVLVGFTAIYIIADLDQETLHTNRRAAPSSATIKCMSQLPPSQHHGIIFAAPSNLYIDPGICTVDLTH